MRPTAPPVLALTAVLAAGTLTACGSDSGRDRNTIRIVFKKDTDKSVTVLDDYVEEVAAEFEKKYPGKKAELLPVQASDQDYNAKIQQMMRAPRTAPDVVYEDSFLIKSDIKSGYLRPLDPYLAKWKDWAQYQPAAKQAAQVNGKTYGVSDGTDTRGIWFNKKLFAKAGLPTDWKPETWEDVLDTARTLRKKLPGVTPLNVFTGKSVGEAAAMQGFQPLLYGTGKDPLYKPSSKKWVTGSRGFRDSLEFVEKVYAEKLGPRPSAALNPNVTSKVFTEYFPEGKLAMGLDGSWLGKQWLKSGGRPWPEWQDTMGMAPIPTQHGQAPGEVSMSGGWNWSIPQKSQNPDLAWKMIATLQSKENAVEYCVRGAQIAVREDVATDKRYLTSMPGIDFFTRRVPHSHYRPALPVYPQVSTAITEAMESVTTGDLSVAEAARRYDKQVEAITDGAVTTR